MKITFDQFLIDHNIDQQELTAELKTALLVQWANEQRRREPPSHVLVQLASDECRWPTRTVRAP